MECHLGARRVAGTLQFSVPLLLHQPHKTAVILTPNTQRRKPRHREAQIQAKTQPGPKLFLALGTVGGRTMTPQDVHSSCLKLVTASPEVARGSVQV